MSSATYDNETYRLWRIRRTVCQMLRDRGYIVDKKDIDMDIKTFFEQFSQRMSNVSSSGTQYGVIQRSALSFVAILNDDPNLGIIVFFPDETSIGLDTIKDYIERMRENGKNRAIIIEKSSGSGDTAKKGISPQAKKAIDALNHEDDSQQRYIFEIFKEAELLVNITEHVLVPKHIPLTQAEKESLLARYKLRETQLPRIKITDPVAKYFGLQRRQVVKIIRTSETAGRYVTYRLVV